MMNPETAKFQTDLEERLRFETLLSDLSAQFVNLPGSQLDGVITDAMRRVCDCLGLDLSTLWQWSPDDPYLLTLTHIYRPLGGPPIPEPMDAREYFPWAQARLTTGGEVLIESMDRLPPEAARDQAVYRHYGVKTALTFPLSVGGGIVFGALSFNYMREERTWSPELQGRLRLIAQVFANALAHRMADESLREQEARLQLAADSAGAGLWILDVSSDRFWITEKARELFDFPPEQEVTLDRVLETVHPEDRALVRQVVDAAMRERREARVEYRIVLPDGGIRWISSRGRPRVGGSGECDRLMGISMDVTERKDSQMALEKAYQEIQQLKERLEQENIYLRRESDFDSVRSGIIGQSETVRRVLQQAEQVAPTDSSVLLLGETGTGKELVAEFIHQHSTRQARVMVKVNCSALPATLIESELFGREKGAFTGALTRQAGRFEIADGSTIFLDEIGDLPLDLQVKLLRVLQEGRFERLGSSKTLTVNVRVIAATNRDLAEEVRRGNFRQDLFYRLNVFPIQLPPLRERPEDIPLLVQSFVHEFAGRLGRKVKTVPRRAMEALQRYPWPGNIRELRNVLERAVIVSAGDTLQVDLPAVAPGQVPSVSTLAEAEAEHIRAALQRTGGRIKGPGGAAELLGMNPSTLYSRMKKLGLPRRSL